MSTTQGETATNWQPTIPKAHLFFNGGLAVEQAADCRASHRKFWNLGVPRFSELAISVGSLTTKPGHLVLRCAPSSNGGRHLCWISFAPHTRRPPSLTTSEVNLADWYACVWP